MRASNATAALVIDKPCSAIVRCGDGFACPDCITGLQPLRGNLYCRRCAKVFPLIDGIPCLLPENGVLAAYYPHGNV